MTVSYNVSGVEKGLKLDGATIADIFLGKIKKWNDPAIAKLNSGVKLPGTDITVCHRSDESGTTKNFTDVPRRLLARSGRTAPASTSPSSGRPAPAPRATTASPPASSRTTARSATSSRRTRWPNNFTYRDVKNKSGKYVAPTLESTSAAGEGLKIPDDLRLRDDQRAGPDGVPDRRR